MKYLSNPRMSYTNGSLGKNWWVWPPIFRFSAVFIFFAIFFLRRGISSIGSRHSQIHIHKFLFKTAINICYSKWSNSTLFKITKMFFDWLNGYEMCMFLLNQMCIHYVSKSTKKSQLKNKITIISYTSHTYSKKITKSSKWLPYPKIYKSKEIR